MIKLMIVDDEAVIRSGIRTSIPWGSHGIEVVAEASNGLDAAEKAISVQPDIIITDIRMPILDGLGLIGHVKEKLPYTHFILLSGYSDTEYLKQAIGLGVEDYIFKNANSEEILQSVLKTARTVESERALRNRSIQRDNILDENMVIIHAMLMKQLLMEDQACPLPGVVAKCRDIGIPLPGPNYLLLCIPFPERDKWKLTAKLNAAFAAETPFISSVNNDSILAILNLPDGCDLTGIADRCVKVTQEFLSRPFHLVVSQCCTDLSQLKAAYRQVAETLERSFWFDQTVIFAKECHSTPPEMSRLIEAERQCISDFISKNDVGLDNHLQNYFDYLLTNRVPYKTFMESVTRLLSTVCAFEKNDEIMDFVTKMGGKGFREIFATVKEQMVQDLPGGDGNSCIVEKSERYVREHLTENPTLNQVARSLYISPGYLSRLFKENKGIGFKQFTYECRIEKAKELLIHSDYKNYEIATMTGFRDYKHFSNAFLKYCGCSAREYRNRCRETE